MASGNIATVSLTPTEAGTLVLEASYQCSGVSSDFNSNVTCRLFVTQNGVTTYADPVFISGSAQRHAISWSFAVAAGLAVTAGLYGNVTGASAGTWRDIALNATVLKR